MRKLKIFFGDLIHDRFIYHYGVPLNIGYIWTWLQYNVGDAVEGRLFKFPDDLISAIKKEKPDIVALSNYDWHVNLNGAIMEIIREVSPNTFIIMGGHNIRKDPNGIKQFLRRWRNVDAYVTNEGENSFRLLIEYILGYWPCDIKKTILSQAAKISNIAYLMEDDTLVLGGQCEVSRLNPIPFPSPWLTGALDEFLNTDYPLSPILETNRGCPYQCTFCTWGAFENSKVRQFEYNRVIDEIRYILKNAKRQVHLVIADANFGILKRDIDIAKEIRRMSEKYKTLANMECYSAKNNIDHNIEIYNILGDLCLPDYAVQTFNQDSLVKVGRGAIRQDRLVHLADQIKTQGLKVQTDLLIGLPDETLASHIDSVKKAFDVGFCKIQAGDIRLLAGSRMEEDDYVETYKIKTRFRLIPAAFGEYDGRKVIEYERCIQETSVMSRADFHQARIFHTFVFLLYRVEFGHPLLDFSRKNGLNPIDLISSIAQKMPGENYPHLLKHMQYYHKEVETEWFDTQEEANKGYFQEEVFKKLLKQGPKKLNYDFAAQLLSNLSLLKEFMWWIANNLKEMVPIVNGPVLEDITNFCIERMHTLPLNDEKRSIRVSMDAYDELRKYVFDKEDKNLYNADSRIEIEFISDRDKFKKLKEMWKNCGGITDSLFSIGLVLQFDSRFVIRDAYRKKQEGIIACKTISR